MKKLQSGYAVAAVMVWVAIVLFGGIGWVENIIKLVHTDPILTGMGIARIVGIFVAPLGAVLGYFG